MKPAYRLEYQEPQGLIDIEYDQRIGFFSMPVDHLHDHYELYCLLEGERIYFIKDRSYRVRAGDLVFVDRHAVHKTLDAGRPDHERIVFYLKPELFTEPGAAPMELGSLLKEPFSWESPILRLPSREGEAVQRAIRDIIAEMQQPREGSGMLIRHRVLEVLLHAWRNQHRSRVLHEDAEPVLHPKTQAIVQYLNDHYMEPLQLTMVAEDFRISPHYLSRLFKQTTGFAFSDYVNLLRIKEAQRLLRETSLSITEVAMRVGFGHFSHFGKMFKRTVRMSPRAYRQIYRAK